MPNYSDLKSRRRMGGIKAKAYGQMFEQLFLMNCRRLKIACTQIPDSCKQMSQRKIIRVKSPFDWVITLNGKTAVIDTKTTEHDTFSRCDISDHQVNSMLIHEAAGGIGGYVIWFRSKNQITFVPASTLSLAEQRAKLNKTDPLAILNDQNPQAINLGSSHDFQLMRLFGK